MSDVLINHVNQIIYIYLFVYLDSLTIISSCIIILLLNQDVIILTPGIIITRGIIFLFAEIYSIIIEK
jgi:hypothetical protein